MTHTIRTVLPDGSVYESPLAVTFTNGPPHSSFWSFRVNERGERELDGAPVVTFSEAS